MPAPNLQPQRLAAASQSRAASSRTSSARNQAAARRSDTSRTSLQTNMSPPSAFLREGVLSLLLFLLLKEWLQGLLQLSEAPNAPNIKPFLIIFGFSIALDWLKVSAWLGWLFKSAALLVMVGFLFYPVDFPGLGWLTNLGFQLIEDMVNAFHGNLLEISPACRTLLFVIGWMLVVTVTQALMLQRHHALWFVAVTLLFLVLLQLLFYIDTTQAIVRTFGCGLLLMALLNLLRIEHSHQVRSGAAIWPAQWLMVCLFIVAVLMTIGWSGRDSYAEQRIKPIDGLAILQRWGSYLGLTSQYKDDYVQASAKSGYGTDDSFLGGPLIPDDQLVFTAKTEQITYWRGESKSYYDGKGWSETEFDWKPLPSLSAAESSSNGVIQEVLWRKDAPTKQIFHGGTLLNVDTMMTDQGKIYSPDMLLMDTGSGKITLPVIADAISYYRIKIATSRMDTTILSAATDPVPSEINETYSQLPSKLPRAVRQLAEQVTAGKEGPYAKAAAIETYLRSTYAYSLDKPTYPGHNEDFVSHFLFVDRTGYCDHFSTAMVMMLRSLDIPARWVKGFAPGTEETSDEAGLHTMQIRAKDAHSWVEVYFPSSGWIPFEPTPGFAEQIVPSGEATSSLKVATVPHADTLSSQQKWWERWKIYATDVLLQGQVGVKYLLAMLHTYMTLRSTMIAVGLLLALVGVIVFMKRYWPFYMPRQSLKFMELLWARIFRTFGNKPTHQTLREYIEALHLTDEKQKRTLLTLAQRYESVCYQPGQRAFFTRTEKAAMWKWVQSSRKSNLP
jgi:hypothetical protein